jgi:hypothetical protein
VLAGKRKVVFMDDAIVPIRISSTSLDAAARLRKRLGSIRTTLLDLDGEWVVELDVSEPFDPAVVAAVEAIVAADNEGDRLALHVGDRTYKVGA